MRVPLTDKQIQELEKIKILIQAKDSETRYLGLTLLSDILPDKSNPDPSLNYWNFKKSINYAIKTGISDFILKSITKLINNKYYYI